MLTLNRAASEALQALSKEAVHACTDVTGFGLIGHACEMAAASNVTLEVHARAVPVLDGVLELVDGNVPGGGRTNAEHFGRELRVGAEIDRNLVKILHDPQTSGGLLVAVNPTHIRAVESALSSAGIRAVRVGEVTGNQGCGVVVV
jgi:selenide,water dikinase